MLHRFHGSSNSTLFKFRQMKAQVYKAARGESGTPSIAARGLEDDQASNASDVVDQDSIRLDAAGFVRRRKQPRSKMQHVVDRAEDAGRAVATFDLSGFRATRISSRIWALDHLRTLDLSVSRYHTCRGMMRRGSEHLFLTPYLPAQHNCLETVPVDLVDLTSLEALNLSDNRLCEVPEELGELVKLKELSLSKNQLHTFPVNLYCLANLTTFNVSYNTIQRIPCEVRCLASLHVQGFVSRPSRL